MLHKTSKLYTVTIGTRLEKNTLYFLLETTRFMWSLAAAVFFILWFKSAHAMIVYKQRAYRSRKGRWVTVALHFTRSSADILRGESTYVVDIFNACW